MLYQVIPYKEELISIPHTDIWDGESGTGCKIIKMEQEACVNNSQQITKRLIMGRMFAMLITWGIKTEWRPCRDSLISSYWMTGYSETVGTH